MDWLTSFYLGCFIAGLIFSVGSFLLGGFGRQEFRSQLPFGEEGSSRFNFNGLVVFLTWFGGAGFILKLLRLDDWVSLALALLSGVGGYLALLLFLPRVLAATASSVALKGDTLAGTVARVSSPIAQDGTGQIVFSKNGDHYSLAARSLDDTHLPAASQVVIVRFENHIAYVDDLDRLLTEAGAARWSSASLSKPPSE